VGDTSDPPLRYGPNMEGADPHPFSVLLDRAKEYKRGERVEGPEIRLRILRG